MVDAEIEILRGFSIAQKNGVDGVGDEIGFFVLRDDQEDFPCQHLVTEEGGGHRIAVFIIDDDPSIRMFGLEDRTDFFEVH